MSEGCREGGGRRVVEVFFSGRGLMYMDFPGTSLPHN